MKAALHFWHMDCWVSEICGKDVNNDAMRCVVLSVAPWVAFGEQESREWGSEIR